MRVWDIPVSLLCDKHLLGEHAELHAIWSVHIKGKVGYAKHPETKRWQGHLKALYLRHQQQVEELLRRGFKHKSDLDESLATGKAVQTNFLDTPEEQRILLKEKGCQCRV